MLVNLLVTNKASTNLAATALNFRKRQPKSSCTNKVVHDEDGVYPLGTITRTSSSAKCQGRPKSQGRLTKPSRHSKEAPSQFGTSTHEINELWVPPDSVGVCG